jgi:hypothetical protein
MTETCCINKINDQPCAERGSIVNASRAAEETPPRIIRHIVFYDLYGIGKIFLKNFRRPYPSCNWTTMPTTALTFVKAHSCVRDKLAGNSGFVSSRSV